MAGLSDTLKQRIILNYFATNIQSSSGATGSQATEITESVLSNLGIWK